MGCKLNLERKEGGEGGRKEGRTRHPRAEWSDDFFRFRSFHATAQMRMNVRPGPGSARTGAASTPWGATRVSAMTGSRPAPARTSALVSTRSGVLSSARPPHWGARNPALLFEITAIVKI